VRDGYYLLALLAPRAASARAAFVLRRIAVRVEGVI
jgi:hypothetical protein